MTKFNAGQNDPTTGVYQSPSNPNPNQNRQYTGDDGYGNAIYADGPAQTQQTRTAPRREDFMAPDDGGGWTQTMNLTPQAQETLDKQLALSNQYADAATTGFGNIKGLMENPNIDTSGMPEMRGIDMSQVSGIRDLNQEGLGGVRDLNTSNLNNIRGLSSENLNNIRGLNQSGLQNVRQLGLDGLPQAPISAGQTAQDAIFSRLNPTLSRDDEALRTRLANQGIALGSSAYNREMDLAGQRANDLRLQAAAQGIGLDQAARNAAFGERKDLSTFDMGLNQQQFGQRQAMTAADMAQRNQSFGERQAITAADLAQRGQMFGENQAMTNADLARQNQQFGQRQAMSAFDINRANQQFGQQQNLASMSGQQRNQALQEAFALQSRPLDLVSALRSGSQVQNPQFNSFAQQATVAGPDLLNATSQQYNAQMAGYNADQAANSSMMGGLMGLGAAGLMAPAGTLAGPTGLFSMFK
jgi:hypothetical protein